MKSICILCGGPSSEYDVSLASAAAIMKNINRDLYHTWICYIRQDLSATFFKDQLGFLPDLSALSYQPFSQILGEAPRDMLFVLAAMHGEFGEDGSLQKMLDEAGLAYTGSDSRSSALAMDKEKAATIVASIEGICTIPTLKVNAASWEEIRPETYPVFCKPNSGGSSINVFICHDVEQLQKTLEGIYEKSKSQEDYLIQPYLTDTIEVSCAYLEKGSGQGIFLPPIEIRPQYSDFFDYDAKYTPQASHEICPPEGISSEMSEKISHLAGKIHKALSCRTYSRSDFLVKDDLIYYLETNTAPGMTETSLVPQECAAAGISFTKLLDFIIEASS
ncbi:MAG: D-alanine--D-alanine ligase [Microgenomates bacterium OLB22]|nr:MAG: D-alanine--D-alanine ligase [Microgenomates bacterium OLB22]